MIVRTEPAGFWARVRRLLGLSWRHPAECDHVRMVEQFDDAPWTVVGLPALCADCGLDERQVADGCWPPLPKPLPPHPEPPRPRT